MRQDQIDLFMATNANNFPDCSKGSIRKALAECPEHRWQIIADMSFKNPVVALILSIFLGELGIDRFLYWQHRAGDSQTDNGRGLRSVVVHRPVSDNGVNAPRKL